MPTRNDSYDRAYHLPAWILTLPRIILRSIAKVAAAGKGRNAGQLAVEQARHGCLMNGVQQVKEGLAQILAALP